MAREMLERGGLLNRPRGLTGLRRACQLGVKEIEALLRLPLGSLKHSTEKGREFALRDHPKDRIFPNFYLINEFGVIPESCHPDRPLLHLSGLPFSRMKWQVWTVAEIGAHTQWHDQLAAKYLWMWERYTFAGPAPAFRSNDERWRSDCELWGINFDSLPKRFEYPIKVLSKDLRQRFLRYERRYRDLPLSDRAVMDRERMRRLSTEVRRMMRPQKRSIV